MAAEGPWRCSQCGTINEPVANSCRTCGRWPSLFDLQESVVDEVAGTVVAERGAFEAETFDAETFEPETFEPEPDVEVKADAEPESESTQRRRRLASFLVPLAFVVYIAISIIFGDR
jgi:predicted ATP-dependent serine protease